MGIFILVLDFLEIPLEGLGYFSKCFLLRGKVLADVSSSPRDLWFMPQRNTIIFVLGKANHHASKALMAFRQAEG